MERDREMIETRGMYKEDHRVLVLLRRRNSIPNGSRELRVDNMLGEKNITAASSPLSEGEKDPNPDHGPALTEAVAVAAEKAERQRQSSLLTAKRIALKVQIDVQARRAKEAAELLKTEQKAQVTAGPHIPPLMCCCSCSVCHPISATECVGLTVFRPHIRMLISILSNYNYCTLSVISIFFYYIAL